MNSYLISARDIDGEDLTWVVHALSADAALGQYLIFLPRFFEGETPCVDGPITVRMLLPAGLVERVVDWEEMAELLCLSKAK